MAGPRPGSGSNVHRVGGVSCDQLAELVRGGDGMFLQLCGGECRGDMVRIELDGITVFHAKVSNRTVFHGVSGEEVRVLSIPLNWEEEMRWNGDRFEDPSVIVWGRGGEFSRIATNAEVATLVIGEAFLEASLSAWSGEMETLQDWDSRGSVYLDRSPATLLLMENVTSLIRIALGHPHALNDSGARKRLREGLMQDVLDAVYPAEDGWQIASRESRRVTLVHEAVEVIGRDSVTEISVLELCSRLGCSSRGLEYAFREVLGLTPIQYLRIRRLNRAKVLLEDPASGLKTVSECALASGFRHLGRFSAEFRNLFGEQPSAVLYRSRK